MRAKRDRHPNIHRDSVRIWDTLEQSSLYQRAQTIFAYFSFGSEVETFFALEQMLRQGKRVCLPRLGEKRQMSFHELEQMKGLERNRFGVYEPPLRAALCEPDARSLMLVPGLAFDAMGNRIGFGGGFYDCYLQRFPETVTVGLAFDFQFMEEETIPAEETDRRLQYVLSPKGIYSVQEGTFI